MQWYRSSPKIRYEKFAIVIHVHLVEFCRWWVRNVQRFRTHVVEPWWRSHWRRRHLRNISDFKQRQRGRRRERHRIREKPKSPLRMTGGKQVDVLFSGHSGHHRPRSFWSAPRIATSGLQPGQTTGHARDLSTSGPSGHFPVLSQKSFHRQSPPFEPSVLSPIILPLQTFFSQVFLLR